VSDSSDSDAGTALVPYTPTAALDRATAWARRGDDDRRRQAVTAARDHDAAALWTLTESWLLLRGRKGASISARTLRNYRQALAPLEHRRSRANYEDLALPLLVAWREENLLRPGRMAGTRWLRELEGKGAKPSTVRVYLAAGRALYAALRDAGATETDPFRDTHPAPDPVPTWEKAQGYSEDEIAALLDATQRLAAPLGWELRVIVLLGAHTGLRVSEMVSLTWSDINRAKGTLVVQAGKGGKRRTVALSDALAAELAGGDQRRGRVLPLEGNRRVFATVSDTTTIRRNRVYGRLRDLCLQAGVEPLGVHSLRHTAGTWLVQRTGNPEIAARILGHSDVRTTAIYSKHSREDLAAIMRRRDGGAHNV